MSNEFVCSSCRKRYQVDARLWRCRQCAGMLDLAEAAAFDARQVDGRERSLWRYRHTFPLAADAPAISLGEGGTPLIPARVPAGLAGERTVHFKLEYLNPTGSFKDRGTTVMMTALSASGVTEAVEDSSGNAGASFAAYAARAGIRARIFAPEAASPAKLRQIEAYGAEAVRVPGPRSRAAEAVRQAAGDGVVYGSHIYNPIGLAGLATAAFEIWEQLGRAPDWVICPAGHGTFLLGLARGFRALRTAGLGPQLPRLIGVQALACAPLWAAHKHGLDGLAFVTEGETAAEGIRISQPVRGDAVLSAIEESSGDIATVDEAQIQAGQSELARLGFYVEPTSAVAWAALTQILDQARPEDAVVVMLTGSGFKAI